ncbi:MAG: acyl-CoA dehydrogenase [Chloroflexi bacterium 13_1_40CM_4_65_16]|nr:MAG: acyl-CoA dehydrogenase [Chloroflexi bacterium 13_1_40CM_4_65_16]OLE72521.1 MAG: acyl-CoA dehydrogenase [Actinobacteria bacterium 13_1_20CM_2_66_18]TMF71215.1 MAG: acyl-CoA dehydrogenase [Chloroflexota bacterium]TMF84447.1 MAG: acyl-CoA dehydrogenase [Chloroflexota bacterium]TMG12902.1 MAG: acyl-CoA dehydrogenase [Chloroflexota bacterium]
MDFELTSEQQAIRETCRDFAREVIAPAAEDLDRNHKFGYDIVRQMGELGLFGLPFAEEAGGAGADFLSLCIAIEEISRADAGVGITLEAAVCLGSAPIYDFGTKEQKERWLPDLLSGRKLWSFGLTEPEAGSDAGATKTRAEARDGKWVINGAKQFITNCGTDISAGVTITAVTGRNGDGPEISALIVPTGTPGYHVLESYRKLGWHSSDTHPLSFEDCEVPAENLLGERGGGYRQFLHTLTGGRIAIAALSVGLAQACLDAALAYAKERRAFGEPISKHQAIQFKLADMAMETEVARTIVYRAAVAYGREGAETTDDVRMLAAMSKLYASEASKRAADNAVQIHGGYGFMEDYPVARYWRDVKVNEIGEGTSEVQRMLIARLLGA